MENIDRIIGVAGLVFTGLAYLFAFGFGLYKECGLGGS